MIVKVKEPQPDEWRSCAPGQMLFTYLHLAPDPEQTKGLMDSGAIAIAYETVTDGSRRPAAAGADERSRRPHVDPGRRDCRWKRHNGGRGVLLGGVPGVQPAKVVMLGGGVVGTHAARMAMGLGRRRHRSRQVDAARLRELDDQFGGRVRHALLDHRGASRKTCSRPISSSAPCWCRAPSAPKLVTRAMLKTMKPGAVLVDVAIDQGGCFETSQPTTHADPTYVVDGIVHYCVANMPGAVPRHLDLTRSTTRPCPSGWSSPTRAARR